MALECDPNLTPQQTAFVQRLRAVGAERYHDKHPFHLAMHAGVLTPHQIRGWVANRYYYQKSIPVKDAAILSNLPDREKRRVWIQRILDHDGMPQRGGGGLELWLALARAVGVDEDEVTSEHRVLPKTRAAVDAYVTFARTHGWLEGVASSLTELFAPTLMSARVAALLEKYPWIDPSGLAYFRTRLSLAPRDADSALRWVVDNALTAQDQDACVRALEFKCDVLWNMLDAILQAYGAGCERLGHMSAPALTTGVRFRRMPDGRGVLLIPEGVVNLNDSAAAIVELIDGTRTAESIAGDLAARFGTDGASVLGDVTTLLQSLAARRWLSFRDPIT